MIMKYTLLLLMIFLFSPSITARAETDNNDIIGLWLTKKQDAAVRVEPCGDEICGYIAWLGKDEETHNATGEPLCQAKVLYGFGRNAKKENLWDGGKVYKADDEKTYRGKIALVDNNTVKLRAYLGVPALGKTKTLTRTTEKDHPACRTMLSKRKSQKPENIAPAAGAKDKINN